MQEQRGPIELQLLVAMFQKLCPLVCFHLEASVWLECDSTQKAQWTEHGVTHRLMGLCVCVCCLPLKALKTRKDSMHLLLPARMIVIPGLSRDPGVCAAMMGITFIQRALLRTVCLSH